MRRNIAVIFLISCVLFAVQAEDTCTVGGKTYKVGEKFPSEKGCLIQTCQAGGLIYATDCGVFRLPADSPCKIIEKEGRYPECCPRKVCPGDPDF
ncbi:U-scoloptoxin(16)-Er13a-like [Parasteatoda tepidariorum]|uniref:U-scoloptoxin(16)-Er13a-like n=1 Tax=Parasteatoda tepidariorum TaxID=114398 RepID=UPI00077FB61A|nr:U-scoloptoxin(16)-Er13a-like [Parasteatoda tepidariorum]